MNFQARLRSLIGRHTRGADKPVYILVHRDDWGVLADLVFEDHERLKKLGVVKMTFNGIPFAQSELAEFGQPLVVMGEPKE